MGRLSRYSVWQGQCAMCGEISDALAPTDREEAIRQLRELGWHTRDGLWVCHDCFVERGAYQESSQ